VASWCFFAKLHAVVYKHCSVVTWGVSWERHKHLSNPLWLRTRQKSLQNWTDGSNLDHVMRVRADYVSVTSTLHIDMTLRAVDSEAFRTPSGCQMLTGFDSALPEVSIDGLQRRRRQLKLTEVSSMMTCCTLDRRPATWPGTGLCR